jgi:glyoxylate reductase
MMRVLITGRFPDSILGMLKKYHSVKTNPRDLPMSRSEILANITDMDGLICMITDAVDRIVIESAPRLKIIANFGVGFNHIDVAAASEKSILVTNTPDVLTDATAELTIALMLAVARRVVEGDRRTRGGEFRFWAPFHFLGNQLSGKTLGIVGMGRIGQAVARIAGGFKMKLVYYSRNRLPQDQEMRYNVQFSDFETLIRTSDMITLHVPLTDQTFHMVGENEFRQMKRSAILVNTSRGPVVNEEALLVALKTGQIHAAGLDVYEREPEITRGLIGLDNVVLLPHVGSATTETRTKMAEMAAENLLAALNGKPPPNCLNPEVIGKRR